MVSHVQPSASLFCTQQSSKLFLYLHAILLNKSVVQELRKRVEVIIHATYSFCKERFISEKRIRDEERINFSRTGFKSYPGSGWDRERQW